MQVTTSKRAACSAASGFGSDEAIVDVDAGLEPVQLRDRERLLRQVDARDAGARMRHRLGEDATAAADVEHVLAGEPTAALRDVVEAQRIDVVQRLELAGRIPPAMRERAELGELRRIGIDVGSLQAILPQAGERGELAGSRFASSPRR